MMAFLDYMLSNLIFLGPLAAAVLIGTAVFGCLRNRSKRLRETGWLRVVCASVSVAITGALGVVVGVPLLWWMNSRSAANPESDTGTAFGMLALVATWGLSICLALVFGSGLGRSARTPGEQNGPEFADQ